MPHVEGVRHRDVTVRGVRLHVAEAGPEAGEAQTGPPILLLHGWPQHWYCWRHLIGPLAQDGRRVVAPDLRGFGWSDAPAGPYDKQGLADDVIALLDALELDRVDLIAHDWGAWVGFLLALDHPDRIAHYLAMAMVPLWPDPPSPGAALGLWRLWYQVVLAAPGVGPTVLRRSDFVENVLAKAAATGPDAAAASPWTPADLAVFADALRQPGHAEASSRVYRTFLTREARQFAAGAHRAKRLTVPTVLLLGAQDPVIDQHRLGPWRDFADDMSVVVRDDAGHFLPEEVPDAVLEQARGLFSPSR